MGTLQPHATLRSLNPASSAWGWWRRQPACQEPYSRHPSGVRCCQSCSSKGKQLVPNGDDKSTGCRRDAGARRAPEARDVPASHGWGRGKNLAGVFLTLPRSHAPPGTALKKAAGAGRAEVRWQGKSRCCGRPAQCCHPLRTGPSPGGRDPPQRPTSQLQGP